MREFCFVEELKKLAPKLPYGIGDDAALVGEHLISTDIACEDIHFLSSEPIYNVIERLIVANISDMAAMGAKAGGYKALLTCALPVKFDKQKLVSAIYSLFPDYGIELIGGDTTSSKCGATFGITIIGERNKNILTRSGAQVGDDIYISKVLGYSKFALEKRLASSSYNYKYEAEAELGEILGAIDGVTGCIDISDGLGRDLSHIADASLVQIVVDNLVLPEDLRSHMVNLNLISIPDLSAPMLPSYRKTFIDEVLMQYSLMSGEEYALAFTVSPNIDIVAILKDMIPNKTIYKIGRVLEGSGCYLEYTDVVSNKTKLIDISELGYEHS